MPSPLPKYTYILSPGGHKLALFGKDVIETRSLEELILDNLGAF